MIYFGIILCVVMFIAYLEVFRHGYKKGKLSSEKKYIIANDTNVRYDILV